MRLSQSWIIAAKDLKLFTKKKNIIYSTVAIPLIASIGLPLVVQYAGHRGGGTGIPVEELKVLLPAFSFFFLILAAIVPTSIASYSLVGEKVEKDLEPLLATPTTDGEILLGKGVAALLPAIITILCGSAIFMVFMDLVTKDRLGYYFFPNENSWIILFLMVPLATIMSVEANVIISSRVSDVRAAQQLGGLIVLPFGGIYLAGELNIIQLGTTDNLLIIAGVIAVVDLLLFFASRATFRREEILTKWK